MKAFGHSNSEIPSDFGFRISDLSSGLIAKAGRIAELLPLIERSDRVGADTEADSLHCYREKLCLLQISVPEGDFLVDPLSGNDLTKLTEMLARKEMVLHGADYDLRLLRRGLNFRPSRVFDTMIAARLLGYREFSYAALVEKFFGVELAKGSQKANWALRPLSSRMEKYARNDTHYLLPMAAKLEEQLRAQDRLHWLEQSCQRAIESATVDRDRDGEEAWRVRGSGLVRGREAAILRALWHWRDEEAKRVDRPAFHILRNDQLMDIARTAALGNVPAFRHFSERRTRGFRAALSEALAMNEQDWPQIEKRHGIRPSQEVLRAADAIRRKRDNAAEELGIEASFIAPRAAIDAMVAGSKSVEELLAPWQRQLLSS